MTSASLFFKLQKEDLKRRIWVVALLFLGFFFAYPVNLALTMENAANSQFAMYNGYTPLVNTGTPEYLAKVLEYKTKAVVNLVSYGNVMPLFLMVTAAAIKIAVMFIFVSSFYSNPENPKNAIAIRPAVTSTIGDPWKLYGISFPSIRSRIPARSTIETV